MKLAQLFGKNQLDEMQERTMLTIESRGFWLVWSLLLVVLLGEGLLGFTMREMAGTWAVFMISCVYIVAACLRAGIWSRNGTRWNWSCWRILRPLASRSWVYAGECRPSMCFSAAIWCRTGQDTAP